MSNLMTGLWTGVSGMTAAQNALNLTAHNIANIETEGFTRQQLLQIDTSYNMIGYNRNGSIMKEGIGTTAAAVRSLRNQFYDRTYRTEVGRESFYDSQYEVVNELEDLFGEMEGVEFQQSLEDIWGALEELSKEPESIVTRATLVNKANTFLLRATDIMDQLKKYQTDLNAHITEDVETINQLGKEIFDLNQKIISVESAGIETANDLRDQRNLALDKLASYMDISYSDTLNGGVQVYAEGSLFVSDLTVNKLGVREIENSTMIEPYWKHTRDPLYSREKLAATDAKSDIGKLRGLLLARGYESSNYTDIPAKPKEPAYPARTDFMVTDEDGNTTFNSTGYSEALDQYKIDYDDYELQLNKYNVAVDEYNRTVDTSIIMTVMSQFDMLIHGVVTSLNDMLSPNKTITVVNEDGTRSQIAVLDEENAPVGMDEDETMGEGLFNRKGVDRYTSVDVNVVTKDENGNEIIKQMTVRKYTQEDPKSNYSLFTLGEIEMNEEIINNYSKIELSENYNAGDFSYMGVVQDMINMWDEQFATISPNTLTKYTFKEYYAAMIGSLANDGESFKMMADNQKTMVDQIDGTRINYSGVSQDEELSNLMKYQYSYNAASRYFNVVNDMLDTLLSLFA